MSSRVPERRLRPLWDAIDSKQYKGALKLASNLLSKQPDSAYLMVLKALVLERLGKAEEALSLCDQAGESSPLDDLTLSTLQIVFQRLNHLEKATLCYEQACSKSANNLELMLGLFNCYVREFSYLKQQQVAMKMHKLFGEERFLLWSVCSIQLQVFCGNGEKSLLLLAEALLKKRLETHGFEEVEALLVYISLLQNEGKYEAALDVLSAKSGGLFSILSDKLKLEGKLLLCAHQYMRATELFEKVLEESSDDWAVLSLYLDAILEVPVRSIAILGSEVNVTSSSGRTGSCLPKEEVQRRLDNASKFVRKLQTEEQPDLRRGPFIGAMEICKRRLFSTLGDECGCEVELSGLRSCILDYYKRFGHMVSFTSDIEHYLLVVHEHGSQDLVDLLHKACSEMTDEPPVKLFRRKVSLYQVEVQLGLRTRASDRDLLVYAMDIMKLYIEGLKLSKDLDSQENLHGEELLTIGTTLLIELFLRTRHPGYVLEAVLILELGLSVRKYCFHYKILLTNLYSTLFAVSASLDGYKSMDVKNILIETLSHHIISCLVRSSCLWPELDHFLKDSTKFYDDYLREAADLLILAYRHCNYTKVLEFVQFKDKIQHSHNWLVVRAEERILQLKQKAGNLNELLRVFEEFGHGQEGVNWAADGNIAALSYNEALETRPWWSPSPGENLLLGTTHHTVEGERPSESEVNSSNWHEMWGLAVRRRCLLPRMIALSLGALEVPKEGEDTDSSAERITAELKELVGKFGRTLKLAPEKLEDVFTDLLTSDFHIKDGNAEMSDLFSLALFWSSFKLASQTCNNAIMHDGHQLSCPGFLNKLAKASIAELTNTSNIGESNCPHADMVFLWTSLPSLSLLITEAFTWYCLCLQSWAKSLQPVGKMGKKKKKGTPSWDKCLSTREGDRSALLDAVNGCAQEFCTSLEVLVSWISSRLEVLEHTQVGSYLELVKKGRDCEPTDTQENMLPPGCVLHALELSNTDELGERIGGIVRAWQPDQCVEKIVRAQRTALQDLKNLLVSRVKALQALSHASTSKPM